MKIGSVEIERYKKGGYNSPNTNARTVELPLGFYFLSRFSDVVELGAVMPYYGASEHEVWDLHDPHPSCKKIDFTSPGFCVDDRNVLSLSTVEHIGFNDYSTKHGLHPQDMWQQGYEVLNIIVASARCYLVTFPVGYNPTLDKMTETGGMPRFVLRRIDRANNWEQDPSGSLRYLYGPPQGDLIKSMFNGNVKPGQIPARFNNGNAVCVVTNVREFLGES